MFIDTRLGGKPRYWIAPPKDFLMRVPDNILNNVVFIGWYKFGKDAKRIVWVGTAFFVTVPMSTDFAPVYLVTAKHVADKLSHHDWCIRANTEDGKSVIVDGSSSVQWWTHPTEADSVDAAVIQMDLPEEVSMTYIETGDFATDEVIAENGIGVGDEVFVIGLFARHAGDERNSPVVRTGNVAMMPQEKLPFARIGDYLGPIDAYLMETRSMGGISGSPVFVRDTIEFGPIRVNKKSGHKITTRMSGPGSLFFLGLNHGHWNIKPSEQNEYDIQTCAESEKSIALGISVIVPAKKILEILNHSDLVKRRNQEFREWRMRHGPTSTE